jgi:hypothetical protein
MADQKISELDTIAAADIALTDKIPMNDVSGTTNVAATVEALRDALALNGIVRFSTSPVADGAVNNGECYIYIDTAASPIVLSVKAKDGSGTVYTATL